MLGLGNYQAKQIVLNSDHCKSIGESLQKDNHCSLEKPFIIWGQGDTWKIKVEHQPYVLNDAAQRTERCAEFNKCILEVLIPKEAIASVIL
ncbi:hypothetical protein GCM10009304_35560 [Pseudomonas matsuisoli]|uniref:Uncharacterized protein n=2 Tax=Pseudomonas matsuisoli TaxID=1515666 RepID=A0A917Q1Y3_9PSED|nr:hypothetical protein GCM10009304_35560 [Pseudomonas matsuisoli]